MPPAPHRISRRPISGPSPCISCATFAQARRSRSHGLRLLAAGLLLAGACATSSQAGVLRDSESWLAGVGQHLQNIYDQGQPDIFLTGYTWHDPHTYSAAKLATLNSHAWGFGYGKHLVDADGNDEMVYAMMFSDSHRNAEPVVGYAKQ